MENGKTRRMRRIFREDGRAVVIPMDHGVAVGPIPGLEDMTSTVSLLGKAEIDAVLVHAGIAKTVVAHGMSLIVHLNGATRLGPEPNWKVQLTSVKDAIRMGADAVSAHINVGSTHEHEMLETFSGISDECNDYGIPTLAMMYPRGPGIKDEHEYDVVLHAARLGYEIGADIVKTNYTGDVETFRNVVRSVKVPVLVAGGPRIKSDRQVLTMAYESMRAGASGVSIGRNVFQHENAIGMAQALVGIVHDRLSVEDAAAKFLGEREGNERETEGVLART